MFGATGAFVHPGSGLSSSVRPLVYGAKPIITHRNTVALGVLNFDNEADFGVITGTKANDTENYIAALGTTKQSIKLTGSGSGTYTRLTYDWGSNQDFRDAGTNAPIVKFRFYVHEGTTGTVTDWTRIYSIRFTLGDNGLTNKFEFQISNCSSNIHVGWNTFVATPAMWNEIGSPAWNAIQDIEILLKQGTATDTVSVTFDHIEFFKRMDKALFAFTFDDGNDGMYEVAAYLTAKGLRGTFYIVPSWIDTAGNLTTSQLLRMRDQGHLIANHTWSHLYWNTGPLTLSEVEVEIRKATEWLCDNGFAEGSRILAWPGGNSEWNWDGLHSILGRYLDQIRLTGCPHGSDGWLWWRPDLLKTSAFDSTVNAGSVLTAAIADKSIGIVGFHNELLSGTYTQADLESLIDDVVTQQDAGNVNIVTVNELLNAEQYWS